MIFHCTPHPKVTAHEYVETLSFGTYLGVGYEFNYPLWWWLVLALVNVSWFWSNHVERKARAQEIKNGEGK